MRQMMILTLLASFQLQARPVRGVYIVPAPEDLSKFAKFPVKFKSEAYENQSKKLTFPLPAELTGNILSLTMEETAQPGVWKGPNVDGVCQNTGRFFECKMAFNDLEIDDSKVEVVLKNKHPLEADLARALELADRFKGEPAGILRYRLRGSEQSN